MDRRNCRCRWPRLRRDYSALGSADPILRDSFGFSAVDLDRLTSASFPAPPPFTFETEGDGGISVNVNKTVQPEKVPLHYRETREYVSSTEDSRYEIRYRYNRVA